MKEPKFSNAKDLVEIFCTVRLESEKAIKIDDGSGKHTWLPKSQLEDWPDVGTTGSLLIPEWLAEEKEFI